ncbi:MAG: S9 family peptidase [Deltaproteobacteria bacterium]|nr:S9 family peptidase [Deltaproteobacteria bacterium]
MNKTLLKLFLFLFLYHPLVHTRSFTIDDFQNLKLIKDFKLSQKGDIILSIRDFEKKVNFSYDFYLLRGGRLSRLTYDGKGSGSFDLSTEGENLYYVYTRDNKTYLMRLPLSGGEAYTVEEFPIPIENIKFYKRDNKDLLIFSANVLPECQTEELKCTKDKNDEFKKITSAYVYDSLYFRPWNFYRDRTRSALFIYDLEKRVYKKVIAGDFDVPPLPFGSSDDFDVSKDGRYILYTTKKVRNLAESTNNDIFEFDTELKTEAKISSSNGSDTQPRYSPDMRYIAFLSQKTDGFESDKIELALYDRRTKQITILTSHIDNWVESFEWSYDSKGIFAIIEERGYRTLYYIPLSNPKNSFKLTEKENIKKIIINNDEILLSKDSMLYPPDLYSAKLSSALRAKTLLKQTRLTDLNSDIYKEIELPELIDIVYDGAKRKDGSYNKIQAFILKPKVIKHGERVPVIIAIHGGPQGSWLDSFHPRWNALTFASSGYVVVMPNITGSTGFGQQFVNEVSKDWGGAPYEDIMGIFGYLEKSGFADHLRVCAIGGSYGGYMTNWILGHTDKFKCLVSHAAPFDLISKYGSTDELWFPEWEFGGTPWDNRDMYEKFSPHNYVKNFKTPTLITHGANDFRVPLEQAIMAFTYLKKMNVPSRLIIFPDEDHFIKKANNQRFWYNEVLNWVKEHLK